MKRFSMMLLMSVLVAGASGCSCGNGLFGGACSPLGGASLGGFGSNIGSSFGQSQGILPSLQDGPVRRWLRGDACDTCNVPAGQITFDSSFDSSNTSCTIGGSSDHGLRTYLR